MTVKKLRTCSGFVIYSYLKDSAFTAVKRDDKVKIRFVKGAPFVNRKYTKGVPFLFKDKKWLTSGQSLPVLNFVEYPPG